MRINFRRDLGKWVLLGCSILAVSAIVFFFSACVVGTERGSYHPREPSSSPGDWRIIEGQWYVINAGNPGKIEFRWDGRMWAGRIWIDYYSKWETLTDIVFDSRTGELTFNRPAFSAPYSGTLSGNQIVGAFVYQGNTYSWEAAREATRRGPVLDLRRIEGQWYVINAGSPGKMEFYWDGHRWAGRIWIDYYSKWETLTDILFDPQTGELRFTRPAFNAPYSGTLSRNQIVGTFIYEGRTYSWEATREAKRREPLLDLRRIQDLWFINNAGSPGKLEFYWDGHMWTGRIWIDVYQQWETLTDILFDPRTGELRFTRPAFNAPYFGTLSGNQIVGTFVYQGSTYPWDARRH